jgi:hypothetical protein
MEPVGSTNVLNWIFALHDALFSNELSVASPLYTGTTWSSTTRRSSMAPQASSRSVAC